MGLTDFFWGGGGNVFYDSCLAAELIQLIKKQLLDLQLESNMIFRDL